MKSSNDKPLVIISTYEERQDELRKTTVMRDEVDHRSPNTTYKTDTSNQSTQNGNGSGTVIGYFPTPPPPPQFANANQSTNNNHSNGKVNSPQRTPSQSSKPPDSPVPDYDFVTPATNKNGNSQPYRNGAAPNRGVIGRMSKTNGETPDYDTVDSSQLRNPSSPVLRPPSAFFSPPPNQRPPVNKKPNRPVSVTIGEYASTQITRKEPTKFDFIAKQDEVESPNGSENGGKDENVSDMLRSELEMTLSRSNLKKRHENGNSRAHLNHQNGNETVVMRQNGTKPILQKTQSTNIEKLTQMLQSKQSMFEANNDNRSATMSSSNRVSITIPNKTELRKTDSAPIAPPPPIPVNGILKNGGYAKPNTFSEKSISFGN